MEADNIFSLRFKKGPDRLTLRKDEQLCRVGRAPCGMWFGLPMGGCYGRDK